MPMPADLPATPHRERVDRDRREPHPELTPRLPHPVAAPRRPAARNDRLPAG